MCGRASYVQRPLCLFQSVSGFRLNSTVAVTHTVGGVTASPARGSFSFITTSQIEDSFSLWILATSACDFFLSWSSWELSPSRFSKNTIFIYLAAPDLVASRIFSSPTRDWTPYLTPGLLGNSLISFFKENSLNLNRKGQRFLCQF